ncbi:hypothetical protein EGW08_016727 [Elysia chlorotica]|uniref:EGF-like domain-containing protein n=1 Tax=Elysia chlorotica TaxID=188477 RepID=A0A433T1Z3_ELYCH|nr:hypothetical protein EGW08_016727 [Elysia chlorotica]
MRIPHTKDNSMRALVDIITPGQTPQESPTAATRQSLEELPIEYYGDQEKQGQVFNISKTQSYYSWDDYYNGYYGEDYDYEELPLQGRAVPNQELENIATTNGVNLTEISAVYNHQAELSNVTAWMGNITETVSLESYVTQTSEVNRHVNRSIEYMSNSVNNNSENPFQVTDSLGLDYGDFTVCDMETHTGCDVIHFERCDQLTRKCRCLHGYVRNWEGGGQCQAASFYHGHVTMRDVRSDTSFYKQKMGTVRVELLRTIQQLLKKRSGIRLLDVTINSVETRGEELILSFDLSMAKATLLETEDVDTLWKELVLLSSSGDLQPLVAINITSNAQEKGFNIFSPLVGVTRHTDSPTGQLGVRLAGAKTTLKSAWSSPKHSRVCEAAAIQTLSTRKRLF